MSCWRCGGGRRGSGAGGRCWRWAVARRVYRHNESAQLIHASLGAKFNRSIFQDGLDHWSRIEEHGLDRLNERGGWIGWIGWIGSAFEGRLDGLDKLDKLDELDELDELDRLDGLDK